MDEKLVRLVRDEEEFEFFKRVYKAVIAQAARDAFLLKPTKKEQEIEKWRAKLFLSGGSDLRFVCDVAEVSYFRIVELMQHPEKSNNLNYQRIKEILRR